MYRHSSYVSTSSAFYQGEHCTTNKELYVGIFQPNGTCYDVLLDLAVKVKKIFAHCR